MRIVVDTSILIDHLRGGTKWEAFIADVDKDAELFLPTIVIFELFSGSSTKNPRKRQDIVNFLKQFRNIDLDEQIAKRAGELFRDFKKTLQVPDYIIAASALEIGGIVATLNRKHFEDISGLSLY